jgi:hypothetical protein
MGPNREYGDELLSRLLRGEVGGGELENRLLGELHKGYPVSKLRLLLKAKDDKIVAAGVWLTSELGADARALLDDIVELIRHPSMQVRFFALDCLVACAGPEDERAFNLGLDLIEDPEPSVRWKALAMLATAPDAVLRAAAQNVLVSDERSGMRRRGLQLLLDSAGSHDTMAITLGLANSDAVLRRYAAAAAARVARRDPGPLRQAMESTDPTIKQFAADMAARAGISESS